MKINNKQGFTSQNLLKRNLGGFTLLELLIVIGILAILSTTVMIVINPADLLARTRDSRRIGDLSTLNSAINLFVSFYSNVSLGDPNTVYLSLPSDQSNCSDLIFPLYHLAGLIIVFLKII
jgi:prepilin-type N-terminal cleavage/methylation domain-containing protein